MCPLFWETKPTAGGGWGGGISVTEEFFACFFLFAFCFCK